MSFDVSNGNLVGRWSLSFSEIDFVNGKPEPARLGLAVQLKFFVAHGFFVVTGRSGPPYKEVGSLVTSCR